MKLKNIAYAFFILLAVCFIFNSIVSGFSTQKTSTYEDKYMTFYYPSNWQVIKSDVPGMVMFNDSDNKVFVASKEQLGDGNNTFEEIEANMKESNSYAGNYTVSGTNLSYESYSNLEYLTVYYLIKKGDKFFSVSSSGNLDPSLIFKTIH
jgi:hypothetical protein